MKKLAIAGLVLAASVSMAPFAFAADATGPGTAGCLTAQGVVKLRAASAADATVAFADAAAGLTPEVKAKIAADVKTFEAKQAALESALAALKAAPTAENATAAQKAGDELTAAAETLIADTPEGLAGKKQSLIDANTALTAALDAQDGACTDPAPATTTVPVPTTTMAPVPTVAPTTAPAPSVQLPTAIDTGQA